MRDRIRDAIFAAGFGPLCEQNPPAGGAPAGDPAPGAPAQTPGNGGGGGTPPQDRSDWIPRSRFDEVNTEFQRLKQAEEARQADEAKKRGDFEALDRANKEKLAAAETRAVTIARRAAFIGTAAGKVTDPSAAYKLAAADGLLNDLDVTDDGDPKDAKAVEKLVEDLVKAYPFLKATDKSRSFGDDRSGAGGGTAPGFDPSKAGARDLLRAGYETLPASGRRT